MNLLDALNSAIEATKPLVIERRHDLETDFPDKPVHVHGDLTRLSQVFTNLLNNAAKYTDKGGELKVSVWTTDDKVYVTVRDNGIGIPGHMLEKIFDMFAQVDGSMERAYGGLGIGLTLVKNIVEMHKGSVTASSNGVGQGSEFLITLPLDKTVSEAPPLPANETSIQNADALRVLVVDDNEASAKTMGWALESFGHIATIAGDGWKALEIAKTFLPHAVLLDIGMPGMNGYEVCRKMREIPQLNHAIFIAQTGWGQKEHLERSKMAGFNFHLVKPVDFTKLQEILSLIGQENSGSAEPRG
jgi:CheY-like chemotaxis protein